jgi:vacuolar-type H+-ATPase subunit H
MDFRTQEAMDNMDGIDEILKAEQEAEHVRRDAREQAAAAEGSAEGYRTRTLEAARRDGEEEAAALLKAAEERAERRRQELSAVAEVKRTELRAKAEANLEQAAAWLAKALSEV